MIVGEGMVLIIYNLYLINIYYLLDVIDIGGSRERF